MVVYFCVVGYVVDMCCVVMGCIIFVDFVVYCDVVIELECVFEVVEYEVKVYVGEVLMIFVW